MKDWVKTGIGALVALTTVALAKLGVDAYKKKHSATIETTAEELPSEETETDSSEKSTEETSMGEV